MLEVADVETGAYQLRQAGRRVLRNSTAIGTRPEHRGAGGSAELAHPVDLDDLGDEAVPPPSAGGVVDEVGMHDQVDRSRDQPVGEGVGHADVGGQAQRHDAVQRVMGVAGVQRAQRPVPGRHRFEHRHGLAAADLADDDPPQIHAQRIDDEVGPCHLARATAGRVAFARSVACLHRDHARVPIG